MLGKKLRTEDDRIKAAAKAREKRTYGMISEESRERKVRKR